MLSEKEVTLLYETIMSAPGMGEKVKLDLRLPRKSILLLAKVIEKGLQLSPGEVLDGLLQVAGDESRDAIKSVSVDILAKAGLSEMNDRLLSLQPGGKEK